MKPDQNDLRSASFTLELLEVLEPEERLQTLATTFGAHRAVVRETTLSTIELWARDERAKAVKLREVSAPEETYQHGLAQGIELVLIGLRRVIREIRVT